MRYPKPQRSNPHKLTIDQHIPMDGFSAPKVAKLLGLPCGAVVPIMIALGYLAREARVEAQWRRPISELVVSH